jgi:hypothetical protein
VTERDERKDEDSDSNTLHIILLEISDEWEEFSGARKFIIDAPRLTNSCSALIPVLLRRGGKKVSCARREDNSFPFSLTVQTQARIIDGEHKRSPTPNSFPFKATSSGLKFLNKDVCYEPA